MGDKKITFLGPFVGHVTQTSAKLWMYSEGYESLYIKIYGNEAPKKAVKISFPPDLPANTSVFENLSANSKYSYKIFVDEELSNELPLEGLKDEDLYFWTTPDTTDGKYRYDFLVMSCHNPPEAEKKKYKGKAWQVWEALPKILKETTKGKESTENRVLFALLGGDQVYADRVEKSLLKTSDPAKRNKLYLEIYKQYWSNLSYRKILCSTPSYLMWDDHDITDGWGSREDSFKKPDSEEFKDNWRSLFASAKQAFASMQASRNPAPLTDKGFDSAFIVGRAGYVLADLRSNRNVHKKQLWLPEQFTAVKSWVESNRDKIDVLFFLTPVVLAHGAPKIEGGILKYWPHVLTFFDHTWEVQNWFAARLGKWAIWLPSLIAIGALFAYAALHIGTFLKMFGATILMIAVVALILKFAPNTIVDSIVNGLKKFKPVRILTSWVIGLISIFVPPSVVEGFYNSVGDLQDDINDSWGADVNAEQAEELLQYLFDLQNHTNEEKRVHVAILTGDIHTGGYSNIYSSDSAHKFRPVISQIVSSPVAYPPFPWIGEAFFRKYTIGAVPIGTSKKFSAQISHHFTERNIVICSLRNFGDKNIFLKVKFYVEGFPEPQIAVFDLEKSSHREAISWN